MEENLNLDEKRGPGRPPKINQEVEELRGMVEQLTAQITNLTENTKPKSGVVRNRTKEHKAYMREYHVDELPVGIVTRLYDVKEVQDKTENRRYIGLCKIDVLNPKTGEMKKYTDVNYLDFLEHCPKVLCDIILVEKVIRYETDVTKGGGGRGALYKQGPNNEYLVDTEYEYEVGYTDFTYTLKPMEGAFTGEVFTNNGSGLNI